MAQLSELLPLLREKCSGMLEQQATDQLKKAYRNFCLESGYLQKTEVVVRAHDGSVTITPTDNHFTHEIHGVDDLNGKELTKGVDYKVDTRNKVTLVEGFTGVEVTYSIVPNLPLIDGMEVDDDILRRWPDEIAAGAAALLRIMPKQTWTDVVLSQFYQQDFIKGHRKAFRIRVAANDERQFQPQSKRDFF
jgi:hypothetical protein